MIGIGGVAARLASLRSVSPHHTAGVILLGGWLLLAPRADVPMREWHQIAAYDTARDCETRKEVEIEGMRTMRPPAFDDPNFAEKLEERGEITKAIMNWRCLPAEVVFAPPTPAAPAPKRSWWPW